MPQKMTEETNEKLNEYLLINNEKYVVYSYKCSLFSIPLENSYCKILN